MKKGGDIEKGEVHNHIKREKRRISLISICTTNRNKNYITCTTFYIINNT